jgi:hypothetical protein
MKRREIHVIIPDRSLSKSMINALVKGYDDCPDEFYFFLNHKITVFLYF